MKDKILEKLMQWAESLENIASEKLPEFATEIVNWCASYHYILFVCFVILSIFFFILTIVFICESTKNEYDNDGAVVGGLVCLLLFISSIGISTYNYIHYYKCVVAPKLVLIEYIRDL